MTSIMRLCLRWKRQTSDVCWQQWHGVRQAVRPVIDNDLTGTDPRTAYNDRGIV